MRNNIRGIMKLRWYLCILEDNRLAQSLKYRTGCAFCICQSWNPWLSLEHSFIIWKKIEIKEILFNPAWWIYGFFQNRNCELNLTQSVIARSAATWQPTYHHSKHLPTHSIPCYNKKRKCPNDWSSPRFWLLSYTDTRPLQCIRLGRSFFFSVTYKGKKELQ